MPFNLLADNVPDLRAERAATQGPTNIHNPGAEWRVERLYEAHRFVIARIGKEALNLRALLVAVLFRILEHDIIGLHHVCALSMDVTMRCLMWAACITSNKIC